MRQTRHFLLLALVLGIALPVFAEGTKQMSPQPTDSVGLVINNNLYGNFASVGGPADSRLLVRIGEDATERIHLGFSRGTPNYNGFHDGPTLDFYYRVVAPSGAAGAWQAVNATTAITTHQQAVDGPAALAKNGGGYTSFVYTPTEGGGDYAIEISTLNNGANGGAFYIPFFDVTVAAGATPAAKPGRLYSRNWALVTPPVLRQPDPIPAGFDFFSRAFYGKFFVYSQLGFVSEVNFGRTAAQPNGSQFRPAVFNITFNEEGVYTTGDVAYDLKSVNSARQLNSKYEIFVQDPDNDLYPDGEYGTMLQIAGEYPKLIGCAAESEYAMRVAVTKPGVIEVLFDEDQASGAGLYDPGTADRLIMYRVEPKPGERAPFVRDIPWDGLNGLGADISTNPTFSVETTYGQVGYHLPIYDGEYLENGFDVTLLRPTPPNGYQVAMQFDDSDIDVNAAQDNSYPTSDLNGCQAPCHRWDRLEFGNENTINTYWYARREFDQQTFTIEVPATCGTTPTGLEFRGRVFDDADGSFVQNNGESGVSGIDVALYYDANGDGIPDPSELTGTTATTDANGDYILATTAPTGSTTVTQTLNAANADGMDLDGTYYSQFNGVGQYGDAGTTPNGPMTTGMRFDGLSIPPGANITGVTLDIAYLRRLVGSTNGAITLDIAGVLEADAPLFSGTNQPSGATTTTNTTSITIPAGTAANAQFSVAGLAAAVQEIVNLPGYQLGNPFAFVVSSASTTENVDLHGAGSAFAPALSITYAGPILPANYIVTIDGQATTNGLRVVSDSVEHATVTQTQDIVDNLNFRLAADRDGDGTIDGVDLDNDNDGTPDALETGTYTFSPTGDEDGDGILNFEDLDDAVAGFTAADDANNDGVLDGYDTDGDGVIDAYDLDSDNDGITDLVEAGGIDADGDGVADDLTDDDGDGLVDTYDNNDTDGPLGSGVDQTSPNTSSLVDRDADGVNDYAAGGVDSDGDGIPNSVDLDSDNDGITDAVEAGAIDANGDGRADNFADTDDDGLNDNVDGDVGNDGTAENTANAIAPSDADGDGIANHLDLDSDNDGLADVVEALGVDADGDGRIDDTADADNDGLADSVDGDDDATAAANDGNGALVVTDASGNVVDTKTNQGVDFDGDGFANWLDRDSDNDGIADLLEAGVPASADADQDGRIDVTATFDTDGDGLADAYDGDANDGPTGTGNATDGAAVAMTKPDADDDGSAVAEGYADTYTGSDGDGLPDYRDLDSDDDGLTDVVEQAAGSTSVDAATGALDGQMENPAGVDFVANTTYAPLDTDGDGVPDYRDIDADNDGIPDNLEATCTGCATAAGFSGSDTNVNGVDDAFENLTAANATGGANVGTTPVEQATDADATVDYLDTDTDGDTAYDWTEGFDVDADGSVRQEFLNIATSYAANVNAADYPATDTDGDGYPDWLDNLDGPGVTENVRPPFLTPTNAAYWVDANGNGLADLLDAAAGGTTTSLPDADAANDADWRDISAAAVLPVDLISFSAEADICDVIVKWSATSEQRFAYYEVLEANAGGDFTAAARTYPAGSSVESVNAYAERIDGREGTRYFQLRMVDLDGTTTVSEVIAVTTNCDRVGATGKVYPNPVAQDDRITVENFPAGEVTLRDVSGRTVRTVIAGGAERFEIDLAGLTPGVYALSDAYGRTQRVVIR